MQQKYLVAAHNMYQDVLSVRILINVSAKSFDPNLCIVTGDQSHHIRHIPHIMTSTQ